MGNAESQSCHDEHVASFDAANEAALNNIKRD